MAEGFLDGDIEGCFEEYGKIDTFFHVDAEAAIAYSRRAFSRGNSQRGPSGGTRKRMRWVSDGSREGSALSRA